MALHAKDWLELHRMLGQAVGEPTAGALMEFSPPVGWADVATKDDLRTLAGELRGEFAELRGEFAELRGEFAERRGEVAELRGEFRGELRALEGRLIKWMTGVVAGGMAMSAGIAAAVARTVA